MSSIGTIEEELDIEGYFDGYWDSVFEHGGILGHTIASVEGKVNYRLDRLMLDDIEAGIPPA